MKEYLSIDIGGTRTKWAVVSIDNDRVLIKNKAETSTYSLYNTDNFFVSLSYLLKDDIKQNIAVCFSFPHKFTNDYDIVPTLASKNIDFNKVTQFTIGKELRNAFFKIKKLNYNITFVNDTVCCLYYLKSKIKSNYFPIGVIVGTGANLAVFDKDNNSINTECGREKYSLLTTYEEEIAGLYLPLRLNEFLQTKNINTNDIKTSKEISDILRQDSHNLNCLTKEFIKTRAEILCQMIINFGCNKSFNNKNFAVMVEGSNYKKTPELQKMTKHFLINNDNGFKFDFVEPDKEDNTIFLGATFYSESKEGSLKSIKFN